MDGCFNTRDQDVVIRLVKQVVLKVHVVKQLVLAQEPLVSSEFGHIHRPRILVNIQCHGCAQWLCKTPLEHDQKTPLEKYACNVSDP